MRSIYLDYNATAPIRPEVISKMTEVMAMPQNPSSVHKQGREAKALVESSRSIIANFIGCWPAELVFTSGGTEANNMVLRQHHSMPVAISATEHASVLKAAPHATLLKVDGHGIIDMNALKQFLVTSKAPALVSVMLANNETGVIQPIADIAALVHEHHGLLHCDAVQALGKIPVDCTLLGADMLSFSAHKLGGPQGVGALFIAQHCLLTPFILGGGQELNRRAGTENVAAIAGFAKAVECASAQNAWQAEIRDWLDGMEAACQSLFPNETIIMGKCATRLPNTSSLRLPGMSSQTQLMRCDLEGFAISAGSACSSGRIEASHVIAAMLGASNADDVVRVSAGWNTSYDDIKAFESFWISLAHKNKGKSEAS